MTKIDKFFDEYRFLSNFWMHPVSFDGLVYPSTEHAYQAAKTIHLAEREIIRKCKTPGEAKKAGFKVTLRSDWDQIKIPVMLNVCRKKFADPELRKLLLDTGDAELIEGNTWNDTFWGVCKGVGENNLGKVLMQIRTEIREQSRKIIYRDGDLFSAPKDAILLHACNAQGVWNSGIAKQFKLKYPQAFKKYESACFAGKKARSLVGRSLLLKDKDRYVGCVITSHRYGDNVDSPEDILAATEMAVQEFINFLNDGDEVHSPKINSGLFHVPWEKTEKCIEQILLRSGRDIKWVVWDNTKTNSSATEESSNEKSTSKDGNTQTRSSHQEDRGSKE